MLFCPKRLASELRNALSADAEARRFRRPAWDSLSYHFLNDCCCHSHHCEYYQHYNCHNRYHCHHHYPHYRCCQHGTACRECGFVLRLTEVMHVAMKQVKHRVAKYKCCVVKC